MDTYERQLERMRQALENAWADGYVQGLEDMKDDPNGLITPNPYVKEN